MRALDYEKQVKFYFSCHYGQRKSKPPDTQSKRLFLCMGRNYDTRILDDVYTSVSCKPHEKVEVSHAFDMACCDCFGYLRVKSEHHKIAMVQPCCELLEHEETTHDLSRSQCKGYGVSLIFLACLCNLLPQEVDPCLQDAIHTLDVHNVMVWWDPIDIIVSDWFLVSFWTGIFYQDHIYCTITPRCVCTCLPVERMKNNERIGIYSFPTDNTIWVVISGSLLSPSSLPLFVVTWRGKIEITCLRKFVLSYAHLSFPRPICLTVETFEPHRGSFFKSSLPSKLFTLCVYQRLTLLLSSKEA